MRWLVKSEPSVYSWDQFVKDKQTEWSGVRNYSARINLKAMQKGDEVLYYHSNEGVEIVGIAKVSKTFFKDIKSLLFYKLLINLYIPLSLTEKSGVTRGSYSHA